jgi:hypothetical protein
MKSIYINGDSLSAPDPSLTVYSQHLAQLTGRTVINRAHQGVGNRNIIRTTLEDLHRADAQVCVVALSFIDREELWCDDRVWQHNPQLSHRIRGTERQQGSRFVTDSWLTELDSLPLGHRRYMDICRQWTDAYVDLYMLAHSLTQLGHDYYIFGAAHNSMGAPELDFRYRGYLFNLPQYKWCQQNPRIRLLEQFDIPTWARDRGIATSRTGHLDTAGHLLFAQWLQQQLVSLNLI